MDESYQIWRQGKHIVTFLKGDTARTGNPMDRQEDELEFSLESIKIFELNSVNRVAYEGILSP